MKPKSKNGRRGGRRGAFTLLEILLVVGLLALLAAFVVPALTTQGEKAKSDLARAAIGPNGQLSRNIDLYKFNTGVFPQELKYLLERPTEDEEGERWSGPYIKDASGLKDPWGHDFQYDPEGAHQGEMGGYDLWSMGGDGKDGTEDDITNWEDDR